VLSVAVASRSAIRLRGILSARAGLGCRGLTFDVFSMAGLILVTVAAHVPFVTSWRRVPWRSVKAGAGPVAALAI